MNANIAVEAMSTRGAPFGTAASNRDFMIPLYKAESSTLNPYDLMTDFSQPCRQSFVAGPPPGSLDSHQH
jgi:hypothetical protein